MHEKREVVNIFIEIYSMSHHQSFVYIYNSEIRKKFTSSAGVNDDDGDEFNSTATTSERNLSEK